MSRFALLRSWGSLRRIAKDLKILHAEVIGVRSTLERIAEALEVRNQHDGVSRPVTLTPVGPGEGPAVEVSYADPQVTEEFDDIARRLTTARGMPPTEDEILEEFERRRQSGNDTPGIH